MKTSLRPKGQACNISKFHIMSMVFLHYAYMYLYIESICYWYVCTYALTFFCFFFWNNFYAELSTALPLPINIILIASNENIDFIKTNRIIHYIWVTFYTPPHNEVVGGILVSLRPSVRPFVRPSRIPCPLCSAFSSRWIHFNLCIFSSKFRKCVACEVSCKM